MKLNRFATFAWAVLGYNLLVILWGAYVRASGSGAGCGAHWPLCNGEIIPRSQGAKMLVELTHRATSGIALLLVVGMLFWALRSFSQGHLVRRGAKLSMLFMISEALVGAGLVLFKLVADNDSVYRAVAIVVHLVNTFLLLSALTLTAWWASGGAGVRWRGRGALGVALVASLLGVLVVGAAGAVTALGDTLFPAQSLAEGLQQDFSSTAHFLIQLRVIHPIAAIVVGVYTTALAWAIARRHSAPTVRLLAWALSALFALQLLVGALNVALLAPIGVQLLHLLMADLLWIALVLLAAATLAQPARDPITASSPHIHSRFAEH
jgi:heme A synthase